MNINDAKALAWLARIESIWENASPYDHLCDEERCVKGKNCTECNKENQDDE